MTNRAQTLGATGSRPALLDVCDVAYDKPIPPKRHARCPLRETLAELPVGGSFVTARTHQAVEWHARRLGIKVSRRTLPSSALRVWRVE